MICSIAPTEKGKPSYYHSFGESMDKANFSGSCLDVAVAEGLVWQMLMLIVCHAMVIMRPRLHFDAS